MPRHASAAEATRDQAGQHAEAAEYAQAAEYAACPLRSNADLLEIRSPPADRRRTARMILPILVVLGVVLAAKSPGGASSRRLFAAVGELGPVAGWQCAESSGVIYDPRREHPNTALVADAPESQIPADQRAVRVEVSLRGGDSTVWTTDVAAPNPTPQRVFVVSPGSERSVTLDDDARRTTVCNSELGDWRVVGDHALQ